MNSFYNEKRKYFESGATKSYEFRLEMLKNLKESIKYYEDEIIDAIYKDLSKPKFESYTGEVGIVYEEINIAIDNLKEWMTPEKVSTPLTLKSGNSYIYPQSKGIVLIISPWNYPFQLGFSPLVGAIAGGNCAIVKPSNKATFTQDIYEKIISRAFPLEYISILKGPGKDIISPLLEKYRFDHIFFTGSVSVGKKIMSVASKSLTPVTLELGGKSPVIVSRDANVKAAAKKITWGKFYNAGQTCIAPDYLIIDEYIKDDFIKEMKKNIKSFYGINGFNNISRIIDGKSFNRLLYLIKDENIVCGGKYKEKTLQIQPTILDNVNLDSPIMQEEIFGPILPVLTFKEFNQVIDIINHNPYPLALYLFTENDLIKEYIINNIQFGGGCINDCISHIINPNLPFGGFGFSGMGNYHSKYSFDTFTHKKSIYESKDFEFDLKYPPYSKIKLGMAKKIMK